MHLVVRNRPTVGPDEVRFFHSMPGTNQGADNEDVDPADAPLRKDDPARGIDPPTKPPKVDEPKNPKDPPPTIPEKEPTVPDSDTPERDRGGTS